MRTGSEAGTPVLPMCTDTSCPEASRKLLPALWENEIERGLSSLHITMKGVSISQTSRKDLRTPRAPGLHLESCCFHEELHKADGYTGLILAGPEEPTILSL